MMIIRNQTPLRSSTKIPFLNTAQLSQLRITEALKHFNPVQVAPGGHELELQGHSIPPLHPAVLVYTAWTLAMESLIGSSLPSSAPRPRCDRGQFFIFLAHGVLATFCNILEQVKWPQPAPLGLVVP